MQGSPRHPMNTLILCEEPHRAAWRCPVGPTAAVAAALIRLTVWPVSRWRHGSSASAGNGSDPTSREAPSKPG
jgi:hypothetical protein